jgi:hypothetical protein
MTERHQVSGSRLDNIFVKSTWWLGYPYCRAAQVVAGHIY